MDFITRMKKHFEVTLDEKADSFLRIHFQYLSDGNVLVIDPPEATTEVVQAIPSVEKEEER